MQKVHSLFLKIKGEKKERKASDEITEQRHLVIELFAYGLFEQYRIFMTICISYAKITKYHSNRVPHSQFQVHVIE